MSTAYNVQHLLYSVYIRVAAWPKSKRDQLLYIIEFDTLLHSDYGMKIFS